MEWQQELRNMECERNNRNNEWKKIVFRKREEENEINSQKLLDAKRKLVQSQNCLRTLMLQKDERREKQQQNSLFSYAYDVP